MAINELQAGLIAAGVAVVLGIFAFNKWQEYRHRRLAREIFKSEHRDVLLDESGRKEPRQTAAKAEVSNKPAAVPPAPSEPVQETDEADIPVLREEIPVPPREMPPVVPVSVDAAWAGLPPHVDESVDCVVRMECAEAVAVPLFWPAQLDALPRFSRLLQWFGLNMNTGEWDRLSALGGGRYGRLCVALQLVDRRGPVSEQELHQFVRGLDALSDRFQATLDWPALEETLPMAMELDQFCAGVDMQIGINVATKGNGFPGTKLRGLAEAAGLNLLGDGAFHARDDQGRSLFSMSNWGGQPFSAEAMRSMTTAGVTLTLDVPRVPDGPAVFNRMFLVAQQLANALNGVVVDDNGQALDERSVAPIRTKVAEFQQAMAARAIQAGSPISLRLFS